MKQTRQSARSIKPKPTPGDVLPDVTSQLPAAKSKDLYVFTEPIIKLYTYDMGRFPVRSRSGNR